MAAKEIEQKIISSDDIIDSLVAIPIKTITRILSVENQGDVLALYIFYLYTAKWQKTNQARATNNYVKKGIGMGDIKLLKAQKSLIELGLIEKITKRNDTGQITGRYIKVNHIIKKSTIKNAISHVVENPEVGEPSGGFQETNALSIGIRNALSNNNLNASLISLEENLFNSFYAMYPRKVNKPGAQRAFKKVMKEFKDEEVIQRWMSLMTQDIERRLKSKEWDLENKQFIPHPSTYLNGYRWEDDDSYPQENKKSIDKQNNYAKI